MTKDVNKIKKAQKDSGTDCKVETVLNIQNKMFCIMWNLLILASYVPFIKNAKEKLL